MQPTPRPTQNEQKKMIDFDCDYTLQNDKIILRPLVEADFELLSDFSTKEPEI